MVEEIIRIYNEMMTIKKEDQMQASSCYLENKLENWLPLPFDHNHQQQQEWPESENDSA